MAGTTGFLHGVSLHRFRISIRKAPTSRTVQVLLCSASTQQVVGAKPEVIPRQVAKARKTKCTDDSVVTGCAVHIWCRSVNLDPDASGAVGGTGNRPANQYGIVRSVSATWDGIPVKTSPNVAAAVCKSTGARVGIAAAESSGDTTEAAAKDVINMLARIPTNTLTARPEHDLAAAGGITHTSSADASTSVRMPGRARSSFYKSELETDVRVAYSDNIGCELGRALVQGIAVDRWQRVLGPPGPMNLEIGVGAGRNMRFPRSLVAVCAKLSGESTKISEGEHTLTLHGRGGAVAGGAGANGGWRGAGRILRWKELPPLTTRSERFYHDAVARNQAKGADHDGDASARVRL